MVEVLAFPLARRVGLIRKQAHFYAEQGPNAAEKNLASQLRTQEEALLRKGVPPEVVKAEVEALRGAIKAAVWRLVLTPGGAA